MERRNPGLIALVSLALTVALVGCSGTPKAPAPAGPGPAQQVEKKHLKVGFAMSQSGSYSASGKYSLEGYQLGAEHINARGGILGRPVDLVYFDDKSDNKTAIQLYEKLITEDKVDIILGPYSSGVTQAVSGTAEKYKMAMLCPEASDVAIFERGLKYIFQGQAQAGGYMTGFMEIGKRAGAKTLAILAEDTAFPKAVTKALQEQAPGYGMTIIATDTYPHGASDFSGLLTKVKQKNPDLIIGASYLPDSEGIIRQSRELGVPAKAWGFAVGAAEREFGSLGATADYAFGAANWDPSLKTKGNAEFVAAYKAKFGHDPEYHSAANYAAMEVLEAALNKAGSVDQDKLAQALGSMEMDTVYGHYKLNEKHVQIGYTSVTIQWQGGKQVVVWPDELVTGKAVFPVPAWSERK